MTDAEKRQKKKEYDSARYKLNPKKYIAEAVARHRRNPAASRARVDKWRHANPEKAKANSDAWHARNKEYVKEKYTEWCRSNRHKVNEKKLRRVAYKLKATPKWANHEAIKCYYEFAEIKSKMTGLGWQVGHIVPLKSKLVCGLHTDYNLNVIRDVDNFRKGNRHWPDMP